MYRKSKYSKEFKLDDVKRILSRKDTSYSLGNQYQMFSSTLDKCGSLYKSFWERVFDKIH